MLYTLFIFLVMLTLSFYLKPAAPFRLDLTVWALRRLPHNIVDTWQAMTYTRIFLLGPDLIRVDITQPGVQRIHVRVETVNASVPGLKARTIELVEKVLSTRENLQEFYNRAAHDPYINPLMKRFLGLKPPRFPSLFEAMVNAVAFQQISLNVGVTLLNRLVETYGSAWTSGGTVLHAFPEPYQLAVASSSGLRSLGFSGNKTNAIVSLSQLVAEGKADLDRIALMDSSEAIEYLQSFKGIGRWSAEYVLLRGMGRLNIFPGEDAGARNSLALLLGLRKKPDFDAVRAITRRWHPFAGLVYFHFLLKRLNTKGYL